MICGTGTVDCQESASSLWFFEKFIYLVILPLILTTSLAHDDSRPLAKHVPQGTFLSHLTLRCAHREHAVGARWLSLMLTVVAESGIVILLNRRFLVTVK